MRSINRYLWRWGLFLLFWNTSAKAQRLHLAEALERATQQNPQLILQRLALEQIAATEDLGRGHPAGTFGYSLDEYGAAGTGIHTLGWQQSFNLPAVGNRQAAQQRALLAAQGSALETQRLQVKQTVAQGYQTLVYYRHQQLINQQLLSVYDSLLLLTQRRAEVGETGMLPLVAAQTARRQLVLQQLQTAQLQQAALMNWRILLNDDRITGVVDSLLSPIPMPLDSNTRLHPLSIQLQKQQAVTTAQRRVLEAQLLPQINTGFQVQIVEGVFPNIGGQIGISVPLFNKGTHAQLKANDKAQRRLAQAEVLQQQQIQLQRKNIWQQLHLQQQQLVYYRMELLPMIEQQVQYSRRAYALGEVNYLAVLEALQQSLLAQKNYLELVWQYNQLQVTYTYWLGT